MGTTWEQELKQNNISKPEIKKKDMSFDDLLIVIVFTCIFGINITSNLYFSIGNPLLHS